MSSRTRAIIALLGLAGGFGVACTAGTTITGSGKIVATHGPTAPFSKIEVSSAFDVTVGIAHEQSVMLHVDDNLVDRLDVAVSNETLHIGLKPGSAVRNATLRASVTATALTGITIRGASKVYLTKALTGDSIDVTESGASRLYGSLQVGSSTLELSGASNAILTGSANHVTATVSGASKLAADRLRTTDLTIDLSGASSAAVNVTGTISAGASGLSTLTYVGNPTFTRREVSGASVIAPA